MNTVRSVVRTWKGEDVPTREQADAARAWLAVAGSSVSRQGGMAHADWQACCTLLEARRQATLGAEWRREATLATESNRTNPLVASAPLPPATQVRFPSTDNVVDEIRRAATELMYALQRQRTAWEKMARVKAELDARGLAHFPDNERGWKLATGDVTWWRGEVNARSNALSALVGYAQATGVSLSAASRSHHRSPT